MEGCRQGLGQMGSDWESRHQICRDGLGVLEQCQVLRPEASRPLEPFSVQHSGSGSQHRRPNGAIPGTQAVPGSNYLF